MDRVKSALAVFFDGSVLSVTRTEIGYSPGSTLVEIVPESNPVELSLSPLGKSCTLFHLYGGVPPDALNW
jgi:hypothetical protein